jgi:hypothetical protein
MPSGHKDTANGVGQAIFRDVISAQVDELEESRARLRSQSGPVLTPPSSASTPRPEQTISQTMTDPDVGHTLHRDGGEATEVAEDIRSERALIVSESLELVDLGRTMATSMMSVVSTIGSNSGTAISYAGSVVGTGAPGARHQDALHPQADTLSLHPVFSRHSRQNVSAWIEGRTLLAIHQDPEVGCEHASALSEGGTVHDDGVPSELEQRIFEATFLAAREHCESNEHGAALVPLEILLEKARTYAFVDDKAEQEIAHLTAKALLNLWPSDVCVERIIGLYPSVAQEMMSMGIEKATDHVLNNQLGDAIEILRFLHDCPAKHPDDDLVVPDEASELMASCMVNMIEGAETDVATQYPAVDLHLTRIRSSLVLKHEWSKSGNKFGLNFLAVKNISELQNAIWKRISLARLAIAGWARLKARQTSYPDEEGSAQELYLCLADLLTDVNIQDKEAEDILLRLTDHHNDIELRAKSEHLLALVYLYQPGNWQLARQHAWRAATLHSKYQSSKDSNAMSLELFVRACELLGDPQARYAVKLLPADWERSILPTGYAYLLMDRHVRGYLKDDTHRAIEFIKGFLKWHYTTEFLDENGLPDDPCWHCLTSCLERSRGRHEGWLGPDDHCPRSKCPPKHRYPVLEFLVSSKPVAVVKNTEFHTTENVEVLLVCVDIASRRTDSDSGWFPVVDTMRLLRLSIVNGNFNTTWNLVEAPDLWSPGQLDSIKDGIGLMEVVVGLEYQHVPEDGRRVRSCEEWKGIHKLVSQISEQGVKALVLRTFLPESIWDVRVLNIVLGHHPHVLGQISQGRTVLYCVLLNAIGAIVPSSASTVEELKLLNSGIPLGVVQEILEIFRQCCITEKETQLWDHTRALAINVAKAVSRNPRIVAELSFERKVELTGLIGYLTIYVASKPQGSEWKVEVDWGEWQAEDEDFEDTVEGIKDPTVSGEDQ